MTPQETDPDLPGSVQESPTEAWVSGGLLQGRAPSAAECGEDLVMEVTVIFIVSTIVGSQVKRQGGNTAPLTNRQLN